MSMPLSKTVLAAATLAAAAVAHAQDDAPQEHRAIHHRLLHHNDGTPPPGKPRHIPHTDERAGYPRALAHHLQTTTTAGGVGYYVGGGVPLGHGLPRERHEGTWGWDETGCRRFRIRALLGWSHGSRYQGGTGAYRTDGPVVPDLIYATTSTLNTLGRRGEEE